MPLAGTAVWSAAPALPIVQASYACSHGVTPGVATLVTTVLDRGAIPPNGDLILSDGVNPPVRIRDCRVTDVQETDLPDGARGLALTVADARWRWRYGAVDGVHNLIDRRPDPDTVPKGEFVVRGGIYVPGTERTPRQLIQTCFDAIGFRVAFGDIPDGERPPANWQRDNPMRAADQVAQAVGCRLVFQPLRHRAFVAPPGGRPRLNDRWPVLSEQPAFDTAARPSHVEVACGDTLVTDMVALRPVGWEEDGRLLPIEELSYRPADNWWNHSPDYEGWWHGLRQGDSSTLDISRSLAREFVWKLFRVEAFPADDVRGANDVWRDKVRGKADPPRFKPPTFDTPIANRRAITVSDRRYSPVKDASGQYRSKPAVVLTNGVDWMAERAGRYFNFVGYGDPKVPFAVDPEAGLVTFARPMYRVRQKDAAGADVEKIDTRFYGPPTPGRLQYLVPTVLLHCSMRVRDERVWQYYRERVVRQIGPATAGAVAEVVRRPDIQRIIEVVRETNTTKEGRVKGGSLARRRVEDNLADVLRRAGVAIAAAAVGHAPRDRLTRTYAGLVPIDPDGAVHSVTWAVGGGPPRTTVGVNTEVEPFLPTLDERRTNERRLDWLKPDWVRRVLDLGPEIE